MELQSDEMEVWGAWFNKLKEDNTLLDIGSPFQEKGKVVQANGIVQDNPFQSPIGEVVYCL